MTHSYHDALSGFSPDQILHDGCDECEARGRDVTIALRHLDAEEFAAAWERAADWQRNGMPTISHAEIPLLEVLWAVQVQLERRGIPIGTLPARKVAVNMQAIPRP